MSLFYSAGLGNAIPDSAIDYFEDGNLDEYSGGKSGYTVQSNTVYGGDLALEATASGGKHYILYNDGVTIQDGDVVRCYVNLSSGQFGLGVVLQSATTTSYTGYFVLARNGSDFSILKDGFLVAYDNIDTTSIGDISGSFHYIDVDLSSGIAAELFDSNDNLVASVSSTDTEYSSGFYGFDYYDTGSWFADNLRFL
jgi:hypothetical protein